MKMLKAIYYGKSSEFKDLLYRNFTAYKVKRKQNLPKMNAWQMHSYGDISELKLTSARIPIVYKPDDILVEVEAASLNPIDKLMLGGYGRTIISKFRNFDQVEFPLTLGRDFAGKIIGMGHSANKSFRIGDNVYGIIPIHKQGSHAEMVIADRSLTRIRPSHWTAIEATSILYAGMTAWSALWLTGGYYNQSLKDAKILVLGASGGVGTVATQMIKSQNALAVGTCSSDAMNLVQSLGADYIFDYKDANFVENVAAIGKYDIILDCAEFGHKNISPKWKYKKYITLNSPLLLNTDNQGLITGLASSLSELLLNNLNQSNGKSIRWGFFAPFSRGLTLLDELVKTEKITPIIHKVFKFSDTKSAYECLQNGHLRGKIVIDMN